MVEPLTPEEFRTYYRVRVPLLNQGRAGEWRCSCPIHHGKRQDSFAVDPATGRWFCHSDCQCGGDPYDLEMKLTGADFKTAKTEVFRLVGRHIFRENPGVRPTKPTQPGSDGFEGSLPAQIQKIEAREVERYPYVDRDGKLLFYVVRYQEADGKKSFRQCRPDGRGGVCWNLEGVERVPYRLPAVLSAGTVYLVEGEKDVHTLEGWGLVASCNPGGAGSSGLYAKWGEFFRGRDIVILSDNDEPGRKHAAAVAAALLSAAASIRIVELPGLPEKGDVTDWRDAGGTLAEFLRACDAAPRIDTGGLAELRARWGLDRAEAPAQARAAVGADWPKPEPIGSDLPPVLVFNEELLPESFRPLVADAANRMQVPVDYPAAAVALCLAGAVNRRALIQPKRSDSDWLVVPNLWGGIVAPPGAMKSPVIGAVTRPLQRLQTEWRREYEDALRGFARQREEYELRRSAWKEQFKAASKKGANAPERPPEEELYEPTERRLIVNDATVEALHETMSGNPAGIFLIRDELTGWLAQLDRDGREGERAFCLQAWNGDAPYVIDRIGRGTVRVEHCCMSLLGGIQPGKLRGYLVDALADGPANDGLMQRLQVLVWPDPTPGWRYVDRMPDADAEETAARVFRALIQMDPENPARFRFDDDAQALFVAWWADLERKVRGDEHPALISHLSKYRKLMPALAVLFELADVAAGASGEPGLVSLRHAQQAAAWCEFLESHARRVYSCVVSPAVRAARELAQRIEQRKLETAVFSARDVYLRGWSTLDTPEAVKEAAGVLVDAGWLRDVQSDPGRLGGRPTTRYVINPRVWE